MTQMVHFLYFTLREPAVLLGCLSYCPNKLRPENKSASARLELTAIIIAVLYVFMHVYIHVPVSLVQKAVIYKYMYMYMYIHLWQFIPFAVFSNLEDNIMS